MIRFSCPDCERVLEVPDDNAGVAMTCPTCGRPLHVPGAGRAIPAESSATARPRLSAQAAPDEGMAVIDDCPECGKALQVPEHDLGRTVTCPRCGHQLVARGPAGSARPDREDERPADGRPPDKKYCVECGAPISRRAKYCPECDARQPETRDPALADSSSKKTTAGICAILVGSLGVHKFILGFTTAGVIMLLVSLLTCGVGAIVMHVISIVEGITYLTRSDEDFYQTYMVQKKEWF